MRRLIANIAPTDASVLINGDTGAGKELIARSLHEMSPRRDKPFIAVNCGALPEQMFESEMFGYEAGAFTGAQKRRVGKLEHASGGTLFLDEIESMPLSLQVKLLRVLQDGVLERLGSNQPVRANLRVVAAAKGDMNEHVADGTFRRDLLYRLNVVTITLPPLNERREDIVPLFEHFLLDAAVRYERPAPLITDRQRAELMQRDWPGNVRELRNAADRMVLGILDDGGAASLDIIDAIAQGTHRAVRARGDRGSAGALRRRGRGGGGPAAARQGDAVREDQTIWNRRERRFVGAIKKEARWF